MNPVPCAWQPYSAEPLLSGQPIWRAPQSDIVEQDREDRHQQQPPLRETDASAHAAIRQRLEKTVKLLAAAGVASGWEVKG